MHDYLHKKVEAVEKERNGDAFLYVTVSKAHPIKKKKKKKKKKKTSN